MKSLSIAKRIFPIALVLCFTVACAEQGFAQDIVSRIGAGVKISTLGIGIQGAVELNKRINARAAFNFLSYSRGFDKDGINYDAQLKFRSVEAYADIFPFGGSFHLSPGLLLYNDNHIQATAAVTGAQSFSLGDVSYVSDPKNPITGSATLKFNRVAPAFLIGWGNLVPRGGKHFSFSVEAGITYQGSPKVALNLAGNACSPNGTNCKNAATDATIQSNIVTQQNKINSDVSSVKVYPLISLGVGYRF